MRFPKTLPPHKFVKICHLCRFLLVKLELGGRDCDFLTVTGQLLHLLYIVISYTVHDSNQGEIELHFFIIRLQYCSEIIALSVHCTLLSIPVGI